MSKVTAPSPVADPTGVPAAGEGVPLSSAEVFARGMEDNGRRVRRYEVDFETGEVRITYYPLECERGGLRGRILDALRASRFPLTRKQLALAIGLKGPKGRFAGVVSALVEPGEIFERDGELTDDASKFSDDTYS